MKILVEKCDHKILLFLLPAYVELEKKKVHSEEELVHSDEKLVYLIISTEI